MQIGRCDLHRNALRDQDEAWRGSASGRGYGRRWQAYREAWLREHPLCGMRRGGKRSDEHSDCARVNRAVLASVVDHIEPHRGDDALFWNPANHQSLCKPCHDRKTAGEVNARKAAQRVP